jgi:hypothetical protein
MNCNHTINRYTILIDSYTESNIPKRQKPPKITKKGHSHTVSCINCYKILLMFDTTLDGTITAII